MLTAGKHPQTASFGLVLLHGRGATASDIVQFAESLALPDVALIAPNAPDASWWPTSFLAPTQYMQPYVSAGFSQVNQGLEYLENGGLPRSQLGVLGFSQGGCLALEYLARHGDGLGYGVALSAGLIGTADSNGMADPRLYGHTDKTFGYNNTALNGATVYMSCHASDPHIPLKRFKDSAAVLSSLGADVAHRIKPGQAHGIDQQDTVTLRRMLNQSRV